MPARERYLSIPFRLTTEGTVATEDVDVHVSQQIEQILFTAPGERVMLPTFGSGARDLVFAANNDVLAAAAEFTIAKALQQHMGRTILVNAVTVQTREETLQIDVIYTRTRDLQEQRVTFRVTPASQAAGG